MASNILRMLVSCHTCSEKEAMLAGLPQIMRMRFAYVLTGCVTASAGILMATDEPISHFSIPEWNWSALIHALVLSVSRELTNGIVYNLATECCWNSKAKRSQTPISNWERKNPHTFQFSCVILFWGEKKKKVSGMLWIFTFSVKSPFVTTASPEINHPPTQNPPEPT